MGRRYTIEEYVPIIQTLNKNYPNILLGTQFMVGFPSESEQDHHQSEEVLKKALFDSIEVYRFSRRLGTLAAKMDLQIQENIKTSRYIRLLVMSLLNIFRRKFTRLYS